MADKYSKILSLLKSSNSPVTSQELARNLGVSSRTIKTYISEINHIYPDAIISSSQGYKLQNYVFTNPQNTSNMPQNADERISYIIHKLFIEHIERINVYDLCDELFLSLSSVKQVLSLANIQLRPYNIEIRISKDEVFVDGNEKSRRKYISALIIKEANGHFIDLAVLNDLFPNISVYKISDILHKILKANDFYLNDFAYINLILHISIIIDRITNGSTLKENNEKTNVKSLIYDEIINSFENEFKIIISSTERKEIIELLQINVNMCNANTNEQLIDVVGNDIYSMTVDVIKTVNAKYYLGLDINTLLFPLALHFNKLQIRSLNNSFIKNPLLDTVKNTCPTLFDCAVYISELLKEKYNLQITSDEIAYIAMHIGADIERQNSDSKKLKCVLLCPNYQNNQNELRNHLLINFDSQITIVSTVSFEDEIKNLDFDLLFSTIKTNKNYKNFIMLPPLKSAINLKDVFYKLQDVIERNKLKILSDKFDTFFSEEMFINLQNEDVTKEEIIKKLSLILKENSYTNEEFYNDVIKRERAASTAFRDIAIPHSMNMNAKKTGVAVAISKHGIVWNDKIIHIILLISINNNDSYLFNQLYGGIVDLFSHRDIAKEIWQCNSFSEFKNIIYSKVN